MNAENGTGIHKWYIIYSMKKREIMPLSFIFSQTLKIPFPHLETRKQQNKNQTKKHPTLRNTFVQKPQSPPLTKLDGCYYRNETQLKDMERAALNSGSEGFKRCKNNSTCIFQTGKWSHYRPEVLKDHSVNQSPIFLLGLQGKGKHGSEFPLGERKEGNRGNPGHCQKALGYSWRQMSM